jgi:hypothetical protein
VEVRDLPQAILCNGRHSFRALQDSAQQVVVCRLSSLFKQERHERSPAAPHAWRDLQDGLVPRPSHSPRYGSKGGLIGGSGAVVEADETYIGMRPGQKKRRGGFGHKNTVLSLVQREGEVRSVVVTNFAQVKRAFKNHVAGDTRLMTDEHKKFRNIGEEFLSHEVVNHSKYECVRGNVSTNTIEGVSSIFTRGMTGVYQHCGSQHLHRYLAEFDFRYNHRSALGIEDNQRVVDALKGIEGKRLTYRTVG